MTKTKLTFNIRETAEILVPDQMGRTSYYIALLMILIMVALITVLLSSLPGSVPLFFSMPWGESRLAPKGMLYLLPSISVIFLIINLGLGKMASKLSPLLPRILAVASAVVAGMMIISLGGIIQSLIL